MYTCTGGDNQNWVHAQNTTFHTQFSCLNSSATQPGDGTIRANGLCLTAPGTLGNPVTVAACNNSAQQRWTF